VLAWVQVWASLVKVVRVLSWAETQSDSVRSSNRASIKSKVIRPRKALIITRVLAHRLARVHLPHRTKDSRLKVKTSRIKNHTKAVLTLTKIKDKTEIKSLTLVALISINTKVEMT